jgi:DMSO/TMAO reductase YedYZ molybdopterin-dependent catalytic subunit
MSGFVSRSITRRQFTAASFGPFLAALQRQTGAPPGSADARLIGRVPFVNPAGAAPLERRLESGLDGRLFTDLSTLDRDNPITPSGRFFLRTAASPRLPQDSWKVDLAGLADRPQSFTAAQLAASAVPSGTHLIECAGNANVAAFGLISAAEWDGAPLASLIDRAAPQREASHLLVSGFDDDVAPTRTSVPGASWIFSREQLERAKAFLAVRMNGAALAADHGAPVRLVVPGWYGCCCIKWVNRIELVTGDRPATSQMQEYAARTHQKGAPARARDYEPAVIDTAAMPIRIEKWQRDGRVVYRVVGILWGGAKPTDALQIRFRSGAPWETVDDCPLPASTTNWTLWSHWWRPASAGRYDIVLKIGDPSIRTRRLDLYFYVRSVDIEEVS